MTSLSQSNMAARAHAWTDRNLARNALLGVFAAMMSITLAPCAPPASKSVPSILLFNGAGASANDVAAVESILNNNHLDYATVNSTELNGMSAAQLMSYRLMIIPGGNFIAIGDGLASRTTANIHDAVQGGLNYLGICAGAILAGHGPYKCLNLTSGVQFGFYADVNRGIHKAAVAIAAIGTPTLDHYWEDGPELTGWGDVVGKYPDGTPAIVEGTSGKGWVILTGVHPEAPAKWRRGMTFTTPASVDNAYAATLIDAALHGTVLPHY
jgi:Biotin-protein ligase, N terminal